MCSTGAQWACSLPNEQDINSDLREALEDLAQSKSCAAAQVLCKNYGCGCQYSDKCSRGHSFEVEKFRRECNIKLSTSDDAKQTQACSTAQGLCRHMGCGCKHAENCEKGKHIDADKLVQECDLGASSEHDAKDSKPQESHADRHQLDACRTAHGWCTSYGCACKYADKCRRGKKIDIESVMEDCERAESHKDGNETPGTKLPILVKRQVGRVGAAASVSLEASGKKQQESSETLSVPKPGEIVIGTQTPTVSFKGVDSTPTVDNDKLAASTKTIDLDNHDLDSHGPSSIPASAEMTSILGAGSELEGSAEAAASVGLKATGKAQQELSETWSVAKPDEIVIGTQTSTATFKAVDSNGVKMTRTLTVIHNDKLAASTKTMDLDNLGPSSIPASAEMTSILGAGSELEGSAETAASAGLKATGKAQQGSSGTLSVAKPGEIVIGTQTSTATFKVVDSNGVRMTLTPTVDNDGRPIWMENAGRLAASTKTMDLDNLGPSSSLASAEMTSILGAGSELEGSAEAAASVGLKATGKAQQELSETWSVAKPGEIVIGTQTSTATFKVIDSNGEKLTLTPTVDNDGRPIWMENAGRLAASTRTIDLDNLGPSSSLASAEMTSILGAGSELEGSAEAAASVGVKATGKKTWSVAKPSSIPASAEMPSLLEAGSELAPRVMTEIRVVTSTVNVADMYPKSKQWDQATKTVLDLGSTQIAMTKPYQLIDNGRTMAYAASAASATLLPLVLDEQLRSAWSHLLDLELNMLARMRPNADRTELSRIASQLRIHNADLSSEDSLKYAMAYSWGLGRGFRDVPYAKITAAQDAPPVIMKGQAGGEMFDIPKSTGTVGGKKYVVDSLAKYEMYDPRSYRVDPRQNCLKNGNRRECQVEQCMWNHMKPINITTAFPAAMTACHGQADMDYFTHRTLIEDVHWGTTKTKGVYFPAASTFGFNDQGSRTCTMVRQTPSSMDDTQRRHDQIHGDPMCHDAASCHGICTASTGGIKFDPRMSAFVVAPIAAFIVGALMLCCCIPWLRKRRERSEQDSDASMSEKPGRTGTLLNRGNSGQATDPATGNSPGTVVGPAAGAAAAGATVDKRDGEGRRDSKAPQAANGEGNGSEPALGGAAKADGKVSTDPEKAGTGPEKGEGDKKAEESDKGGKDPSSPADGDKPKTDDDHPPEHEVKDDGRGTTGRAAEEGRAKVHFDNDRTPQPVADDVASHEQSVPAHQTDGAGGMYTGRQMADHGSVRGRKRTRPEGGKGLNLGF